MSLPVRLVDRIEKRADDAARERRRGLQHLHRNVEEEIELALRELARVEGVAGDKGGKARIGEPFGLLAHVAVDAREGFLDELLQLTCEVTGARRSPIPCGCARARCACLSPAAPAARRDARACAPRSKRRIEDEIGEQRLDHRLAAAFEELAGRVDGVRGRGAPLAADPIDDGTHVGIRGRAFRIKPIENVEAGLGGAGGVDRDDPMAHAWRAGRSIGSSSVEGSRVTIDPR